MDTTRVSLQARPKRPKIVIIGGGFGGLYAAKALSNAAVAVTLIGVGPAFA
jgi:NADH dehydrogenase